MLDGVRVLDATWVLGGPFAGQLLAQLGAEVIKVEPLDGDMARTLPPVFFNGDSSFFLSANRGKKSIALDLKAVEGKSVFLDLVRNSDAVIYAYTPGVPVRLGIDFESLRRINPRICLGQIIGLHDEEEYLDTPAFDLVVQALGGVMGITGNAGEVPVRVGYQVADLAGGLYLALGVVGALLRAARSGKGAAVQVSLLDCQLALLTWQAQNYLISNEPPQPTGSRHPMLAPSESFRASDGRHIAVSPTGQRFWNAFCQAVGKPEIATDDRFATPERRIQHVDALSAVLSELFASQPSGQWIEQLRAARVPAAMVLSVPEALAQPVAALRGMVETVIQPSTGEPVGLLGNPFKLIGEPMAPLAYPPTLGQDAVAVLKGVCRYGEEQIDNLMAKGIVGGHPEVPRPMAPAACREPHKSTATDRAE